LSNKLDLPDGSSGRRIRTGRLSGLTLRLGLVLNRRKERLRLLQLFRELDPRASEFGEMVSLLWCACAFGELHTIERVLTTLFGIAWHFSPPYATPFPVAEAQSIPKKPIIVKI
jgi:hypothetical protein